MKRTWSLILMGGLYVFCALISLKAVPLLIHDIGSDDHLFWYLLPYYLETLLFVYLLFVVHCLLHPKSKISQRLVYFVNGIILTVLSFLVILVDIIHLATGDYTSIVMGHPTLGYPLDNLILGFVLLIIGFFFYLKGSRFAIDTTLLFPREIKSKTGNAFYYFFFGLASLLSLWYLGDFLLVFIAFDTSFKHFAGMLILYLMMLVPSVLLAIKELWLRQIDDEEKRKRKSFITSLLFLCIGIVLSLGLIIAMNVDPDFILEAAPAYLPLDMMASVNFGPISLIFINIVLPLLLLLISFKKKDRQAQIN